MQSLLASQYTCDRNIATYGRDQHSPFDKENVFLLNADINHYLAIFLALNGH